MSGEGWAAWELPASEHLRTVAEILSAPPAPEERRALRREQAEAEAKRASAADTADNAAAAGFMARLNGHAPRDPLAVAAAGEPFRDREAARPAPGRDRRAAAAGPGGRDHGRRGSGVILDANMGILEPVPDRGGAGRTGSRSTRPKASASGWPRSVAGLIVSRCAGSSWSERRRARWLEHGGRHSVGGRCRAAAPVRTAACARDRRASR